jgi:hypothetical protein
MSRLFPLGLLLCLVLAAPAHAKEVLSAKVCGENGCVTSRDRALIAGLAEGGDPVDPPKAAAPFFRVRLTIGDERGKVMDRFWTLFTPKGELIRGSDGTWMRATDAYTGALKKVVNPSMLAYPASRSHPETDGGGSARSAIGLIGGGTLAVAVLLLFAVRRRRRVVARPSAA